MQQIINSIISLAHLFLVAVGFALIYRTGKIFHFAHAAVYVLGAYTAYWVEQNVSHIFGIKFICGTIAGVVVGCLMELFIYRQLRKNGAPLIALIVASLGLLITIQSSISLLFGDAILGLQGFAELQPSSPPTWVPLTNFQILFLVTTTLTGICLALFLIYSNLGIVLRAVADDWELSAVIGIGIDKCTLLAICIGSAFASMAGIFWSHYTALHPTLGVVPLLNAIAATVIGGASNLLGTLLGCVLVVMLQQLSLWFLPSEWNDVLVFVALLIFLIIRPYGLMGRPIRKAVI